MQKNNRNGEKTMFKKIRIKLFGRSKKEIYKDIHLLSLEVSDILENMSILSFNNFTASDVFATSVSTFRIKSTISN